MLPFATVATLQYFLRATAQDVNRPLLFQEMWRIYIFPFDHFWFLQAIFLVFLTVGLLDAFCLIKSFAGWLIAFLAAIVATLALPRFTAVFGFNGYLYLLPYFLLGCGLCRFALTFRQRWVATTASFVSLAGLIFQQLIWFNGWQANLDRASPLSIDHWNPRWDRVG